ncbi:SPOR domain-containing protein [Saccharophagus sp. K07]|jgi:cell division protein FtsN|uniref:SPOR domain-containing protein n=1 Tax=Saccharophagus sp. K07 TaxID=2283636 RepID=UPI001652230C|nr:SPOR domain-containing protein [Saccharophagus sp. K07]MBC6906575.1 SPOR domain-containing protein [Saccharophagus sp. K07]
MRWIVWFLLAANALLLIWSTLVAAPKKKHLDRPVTENVIASAPAETISLLNELDPQQMLPRAPPEPQTDAQSVCLMVGPFANSLEARQFSARLAALDVQSFEHSVDLPAGEGYWVYLEPLTNRDAARRRLAELQARGVDSYIIPKGELENGISLGVFTRRDLAEARVRELTKQGLTPKLQSVGRSYREIWVMLGQGEEFKIAETAWQSLMREHFSLQQRQNLCSDVASAKNFH